jgi:hypothetical protein
MKRTNSEIDQKGTLVHVHVQITILHFVSQHIFFKQESLHYNKIPARFYDNAWHETRQVKLTRTRAAQTRCLTEFSATNSTAIQALSCTINSSQLFN